MKTRKPASAYTAQTTPKNISKNRLSCCSKRRRSAAATILTASCPTPRIPFRETLFIQMQVYGIPNWLTARPDVSLGRPIPVNILPPLTLLSFICSTRKGFVARPFPFHVRIFFGTQTRTAQGVCGAMNILQMRRSQKPYI